MFKNKLGEDSPIQKFIHLKIRRRDGVESLTTLEEVEFKVPIDGCINRVRFEVTWSYRGGSALNVRLLLLISDYSI